MLPVKASIQERRAAIQELVRGGAGPWIFRVRSTMTWIRRAK